MAAAPAYSPGSQSSRAPTASMMMHVIPAHHAQQEDSHQNLPDIDLSPETQMYLEAFTQCHTKVTQIYKLASAKINSHKQKIFETARETNNHHLSKVSNLQAELGFVRNETHDLRFQLQGKAADIVTLEERLEKAEKDWASSFQVIEARAAHAENQLTNERIRFHHQLRASTELSRDRTTALQDKDQQISSLKSQLEETTRQVRECASKLEAKSKILEALTTELAEAKVLRDRAKAEAGLRLEAVSELERQLQEAKESSNAKSFEISDLREQLKHASSEVDSGHARIGKASAEMLVLDRELREARSMIDNLELSAAKQAEEYSAKLSKVELEGAAKLRVELQRQLEETQTTIAELQKAAVEEAGKLSEALSKANAEGEALGRAKAVEDINSMNLAEEQSRRLAHLKQLEEVRVAQYRKGYESGRLEAQPRAEGNVEDFKEQLEMAREKARINGKREGEANALKQAIELNPGDSDLHLEKIKAMFSIHQHWNALPQQVFDSTILTRSEIAWSLDLLVLLSMVTEPKLAEAQLREEIVKSRASAKTQSVNAREVIRKVLHYFETKTTTSTPQEPSSTKSSGPQISSPRSTIGWRVLSPDPDTDTISIEFLPKNHTPTIPVEPDNQKSPKSKSPGRPKKRQTPESDDENDATYEDDHNEASYSADDVIITRKRIRTKSKRLDDLAAELHALYKTTTPAGVDSQGPSRIFGEEYEREILNTESTLINNIRTGCRTRGSGLHGQGRKRSMARRGRPRKSYG